ncbi:Phosphohistidine phosphatase SixA [Lutibacter oricola]|uniref:Phosphohistidine phosphatase SixA n=1 Tax=Lutibacter oricola TaxID=762486 RepID=A0A1H2XKS9_9FLAO|nr:phosphoglycerate mutase family protein [Lutibacter oricola]SDW93450.1 Phosphohistidine phosphatase SixA [Lutibacter oricola]
MKHFFIIILTFFWINSYSQGETKYFFIRHAEKNQTDKTNKNPDLSEKGKKRAIYWSEVLKSVEFDDVYSTNYKRTEQTASPTAVLNNVKIKYYNPRDLYSEDFQKKTKGKTILIVGHSNTTPSFVNKVIGKEKYKQIDESNNSNLYIVTLNKTGIMDVLLKIAHKKSH